VIQVTRTKITSTVYKYGGRKYKCSVEEQQQRVKEEKFLTKLRKLIYPILEIPTRKNIVYANSEILDLVAKAGLRHSFIEDMSNSVNRKARGKVVPDGDTVYYRLKKLNKDRWTIKLKAANKKLLLLARKRRMIPSRPSLSIDKTSIMFYGDKESEGVRGTKPKKGSCRAYEYVTGCLSDCDWHLTLDGVPLEKETKLWEGLEDVLKIALKYVNNRQCTLYVDREFYCTPVIDVINKYKQKYLMPAKKTAPVKELIKTHKIPCVLPYTMKGKYGTADTTLVLVEDDEGDVKAFITNLNVDASQAKTLFDKYQNRWTVDTSYRQVGEVRMNSKTLDFAVRWFLFFFSLLLLNIYWLFNNFIKDYDHVTLITSTEMFIEVTGALFEIRFVNAGDG